MGNHAELMYRLAMSAGEETHFSPPGSAASGAGYMSTNCRPMSKRKMMSITRFTKNSPSLQRSSGELMKATSTGVTIAVKMSARLVMRSQPPILLLLRGSMIHRGLPLTSCACRQRCSGLWVSSLCAVETTVSSGGVAILSQSRAKAGCRNPKMKKITSISVIRFCRLRHMTHATMPLWTGWHPSWTRRASAPRLSHAASSPLSSPLRCCCRLEGAAGHHTGHHGGGAHAGGAPHRDSRTAARSSLAGAFSGM